MHQWRTQNEYNANEKKNRRMYTERDQYDSTTHLQTVKFCQVPASTNTQSVQKT